jgi:peptidyl-prolyl cis-trans isomerase SDCCAG10
VFEEHDRKVKDANIPDEDTFEIFDPRNPINKRRREESKRTQKEKKKK